MHDVQTGKINKGKGLLHVLCVIFVLILRVGREESSFIAESSFVKAPLNSRVGPSTTVPNGKGKGKQESLDRLPLEIQESLVLEDLLFVLTVCTFVI